MTQPPITPPPELTAKWVNESYGDDGFDFDIPLHPITLRLVERAAQWGADQELEACLTEVSFLGSRSLADKVRAARRPKPPSLKEQSIALIDRIQAAKEAWDISELDTIRRALEQLDG